MRPKGCITIKVQEIILLFCKLFKLALQRPICVVLRLLSTMRKINLLGGLLILFLWVNVFIVKQRGHNNSGMTVETNHAVVTTREPNDQKRCPLDPFMDLTFSRDALPRRYSSYHCVATGTQNPKEQADPHSGCQPNWVS